jgi:hypothetical protein
VWDRAASSPSLIGLSVPLEDAKNGFAPESGNPAFEMRPFKPEPLRFELAGCWSRRITQEHRLVYRVTAEWVEFLQTRYHYEQPL